MNKKHILLIIVIGVLIIALPAAARPLYQRLSASEPIPAASAETVEAPPESPEALEEERPEVPDFTVTDMEGNAVSLSDFAGKAVAVNFWATWCPPCRGELPAFEKAWETHGDDVEFMMVALVDGSRETEATVRDFIDENGYNFPVYMDLDQSAAGGYGVYSIPMTVLIDANGRLFGGQIGAMDESTLFAAVEALAAESE